MDHSLSARATIPAFPILPLAFSGGGNYNCEMNMAEGWIRRNLSIRKNLSLWLALALAVALIFFFDYKGIQFYLVPSKSMAPTLEESDYIGGFRIEPSELKRGDIVVFTSAKDDEDFYVKRVIGLPGDTITILDGFVYIDGRRIEEPYVVHRGTENHQPITIPEGKVFVMGDNRTNSVDSRNFGPISKRRVDAKITFIYNPISRMGTVK